MFSAFQYIVYVRSPLSYVSQPFCVDQLNPAGFDVPDVLIRKTPALFLRRKLEIKKQIWRRRICRRRHLLPGQPVTLTMTFPLRILLKMKTKIHTLKLPVIIHHQTQKQKTLQSPQEFDDAKVKAKADLNWIKLSSRRTDQITGNNLQEMAAWLFSAVFVQAKRQRALNTY